jgi:hypothetical protein
MIKDDSWDCDPNDIDNSKNQSNKKICHGTYCDPDRSEYDTQNPSDHGVILIEWFKKMPKGDFNGKRPVCGCEHRHEPMRDDAGTIQVPMMKKIE